MLDFLGDLKRTHMCGELRASDAGSKVVLMGWVNRRRDLGNLIFLDLRDRSGITQVGHHRRRRRRSARPGDRGALGIRGRRHRPREAARCRTRVNKNIPTGEIEVVADELRILNDCKPLPFTPGRHGAGQRRGAPEVSLRRPAPAGDAAQHRAAPPGRDRHSRIS